MQDDRRQIRAIILGLEEVTERTVRKITLDVTANLKEATPVRTGWARANWVPSIGTSFEADLTGVTPSREIVPGAEARQAQGEAEVATQYQLARGPVFVSNNVPYIVQLNEGSSRKAPAGFVQAAIEKAVTRDIKSL